MKNTFLEDRAARNTKQPRTAKRPMSFAEMAQKAATARKPRKTRMPKTFIQER